MWALVAVPITVTTLAVLIGERSTLDPYWFRVGLVGSAAGVAAALTAAMPALIERIIGRRQARS